MIHIRTDSSKDNGGRRFACGLGPDLPEGDTYFFAAEAGAHRADCPGCNPEGPPELGASVSELSGRPGHKGFDRFRQIAETWGYP